MDKQSRSIHTTEYYVAIKTPEHWHSLQLGETSQSTAKCKKSRIEGHIFYDDIYMKHPEQAKPQRQIGGCLLLGEDE